MTSTIVSITSETPTKVATTLGDAHEPNPPRKQWSRGTTSRFSDCGLLAKRCFGEKVRPSAGLCMIAFAVPLVVPGITLTVVAFEDGTEFTKYGALHVLGFVLLISAILLTTAGVLLNTRYKFQITSKESTPKLSSDEKDLQEVYLDTVTSPSPNENLHKTDPLAAVFVPNSPKQVPNSEEHPEEGKHKARGTPAEVSTSSNNGQKHVSFSARKISRRQFSSNKSFDDNSSSFDSFDSEDFSSGSYILSEDIEWERPILELESETETAQEINDPKPCSSVKQSEDRFKKPVFDFGDLNSYSKCIMDARFSFPSKNDDMANLSEVNNDYIQSPPGTSDIDAHSSCGGLPCEKTQQSSHITPEHEDGTNSPGSRQRLYGLSSEVSVASSDSQITSRDSIKIHDVALKDNSDSNSSVFSLERLPKPAGDTPQDDEPLIILAPKSTQLKTWAQSPPTKRPNSFPIGAEIPVSPGRVARNNSLTETHIISLDEFSR